MTDQANTTVSELLPCPFCGDKAISGTTLDDFGYVVCVSEKCWGMAGYLPSEAEAVAAWNRRATEDVTETLENNDDQDTTLETEELDQIASTDSATTGLDVHGESDAEGLKAATNKVRSVCHRFAYASSQPDIEGWLKSSAYSVIRAYLAALNPPMGR